MLYILQVNESCMTNVLRTLRMMDQMFAIPIAEMPATPSPTNVAAF